MEVNSTENTMNVLYQLYQLLTESIVPSFAQGDRSKLTLEIYNMVSNIRDQIQLETMILGFNSKKQTFCIETMKIQITC